MFNRGRAFLKTRGEGQVVNVFARICFEGENFEKGI